MLEKWHRSFSFHWIPRTIPMQERWPVYDSEGNFVKVEYGEHYKIYEWLWFSWGWRF